ncbi:MAG TPA: amidohydrolase family protein [Acidimicrobiales bacterium]|nr:amidohydrolase family protein [Acidimicrobiales bacterium]
MASAPATCVRAATVFTASGPVCPGEVRFEDGLITTVGPATGAATYEILAPGFIDLQMNGIGAVDVADADGDDWDVLDDLLLAQGVTTWCPTLVSATLAAMEASLERITGAAGRPGRGRPAIAGAHLEGPFLAVAGAHHPPSLHGSVDGRWLAGLGSGVALVTLAPELPGALAAIEALVGAGVLVSLGHSACDLEVARAAADAGARLVTHLGNAMGPFRPRAPGLLGAALSDDRLAVSLIADLVHIDPALVRIAFRSKGAARTVLVTDAVAVGPVGPYAVATSPGAVGEPPRMADGTLVGSVLAMDRAVANTVTVAGIGLGDAIAAASTTPASLLGLDDRGAISPGRRADLVALGADLEVERVWVGGEPCWRRRTGAEEGSG